MGEWWRVKKHIQWLLTSQKFKQDFLQRLPGLVSISRLFAKIDFDALSSRQLFFFYKLTLIAVTISTCDKFLQYLSQFQFQILIILW